MNADVQNGIFDQLIIDRTKRRRRPLTEQSYLYLLTYLLTYLLLSEKVPRYDATALKAAHTMHDFVRSGSAPLV